MPSFIILPAANVSAGKITSLTGAQVTTSLVVPVAGGTYKVFAATGLSAVFTPTGSTLTPGPGVISGSEVDQFLVVPETNVSGGSAITSLAGAFVSSSLNLTGLISGTQYRVTALTAASPDIIVLAKPAGFTSSMWNVVDAARGGILTYTISSLPYNGGSPITGVNIYLNGSATPALTAPGIGTYELTGLTNGTSYASTLKAVNAIGVSDIASDTKTRTPTAQVVTPPSGTQVATFGSLTLANAGAFKPVDANGNPLDVTAISPSTGGAVIQNNGLAFSTAGGGTAGATYALTTSAGVINVQIAKQANTYSVASYAEMLSAEAAAPVAGGWTILCRRGRSTYMVTGRTSTKVYTNRVYIVGEGSWSAPDANGIGSYRADVVFPEGIEIRSSRMTVRNIRLRGIGLDLFGTPREVHCENCHLGGDPINWQTEYPQGTTADSLGLPYTAVRSGTADTAGLQIRQCLIEFVDIGILINQTSPIKTVFEYNEVRHTFTDTMKVQGSASGFAAGFTYRYNYCWGPFDTAGSGSNTPHADIMFQIRGTDTIPPPYYENFEVYGNVANAGEGGDTNPQGIFMDYGGKPTTVVLRGMKSVGNLIALGGNQHHSIQTDNFIGRNNTIVRNVPNSATGPGARMSFYSDPYADPLKSGYVIVENNIMEDPAGQVISTQTKTEVNNAYLGNLNQNTGATAATIAAYNAMFPNWRGGRRTNVYNELIEIYRPSDPNKGYGANTGITYGQPRQIAGWNVPAALLVR